MYSNVAFGLTLLGIFSIIENINSRQKFSETGNYMILILICLTFASFIDYLGEYGYSLIIYKDILRVTSNLLSINLFFFICIKRMPKFLLKSEFIFILFFIFQLINGFQFPIIKDGILINSLTKFHLLFYILFFLSIASSIFYIKFKLYLNKNSNNLYEIKINRWFNLLVGSFLFLFTLHLVVILLYLKGINLPFNDSRITLFLNRFLILLFILLRPKFLDVERHSTFFNKKLVKNNIVSYEDFEFLFYSNHYYLNCEANLDDFALKLNHSKQEVLDFLKNRLDESFTDLLNQNRIEYLKELLKSKKYEIFTIESLSEISGFNTRRSMYNSFKKYVGITPSEFISTLK